MVRDRLAWASLALALWLGASLPALSQTPSTPGPQAILGGLASLAVTTTSASVALPASAITYPVVTFINDGAAEVFIRLGNSSVVATASFVPLPAGASVRVWTSGPLWTASPATYVAAIAATGTSTLRILQANGP